MRTPRRLALALAAALVAACTPPPPPAAPLIPPPSGQPQTTAPARHELVIVGTNDLHGHIEMLPILAGYLANLRAAHPAVLLVDGGDLFQGTLESNLNEGVSVIEAMNALGYAASAVGNHEFDFGPVGERATPGPGDDPRGALKARAAEAHFPLLAANLVDQASGAEVDWPNVHAATEVVVDGVHVAIVGVATESTPHTTIATNFAGLAITPLADAIAREARARRAAGAEVVVVVAHAGGACHDFDDASVIDSCDPDQEIFQVARALPPGLVDVIVAGHTHAGIAHEVAGIPVIESYSKGIAFGRVDLTVEDGHVVGHHIAPPSFLCQYGRKDDEACETRPYEGKEVVADPAIAAIVGTYQAAAQAVRDAPLGVTVSHRVRRAHGVESALGNLFADLMRAARPKADVAVTNGGGLRADLPEGALTYGRLYEAMPFDNRFALVRLTGADLARLIAVNLERDSGILSVSGMSADAACKGSELVVTLHRDDGRVIKASQRLLLATSDFLAVGGDGMFGTLGLAADAIHIEEAPTIRDEIKAVLVRRGGTVDGDHLVDHEHPRLRYPGTRPVHCPAATTGP